MGLLQGISGYTDHACLESSSVKKGKLFSVEEFISWLGQFKASIVTTIEIILIIERFGKLDNVWHMFFFVVYCSFYLVRKICGFMLFSSIRIILHSFCLLISLFEKL